MFGYIYLILNKVNGHTYVGKHESSKEWFEDKYPGSGKLLKPAHKKYGIKNFEKFLIQYCYDKESLNAAEKFWIAEYRSRGKAEYNISDGGDGGRTSGTFTKGHKPTKGCLGKRWKLSEETKRKQSEDWHKKHPNAAYYGSLSGKNAKGTHWYNNGETQVRAFECPEGFTLGRLHKPSEWLKKDPETGRFMKKRG